MILSLFCEFDERGRLDRVAGTASELVKVDTHGLAVRLAWPASMGVIDTVTAAEIEDVSHGMVDCRATLGRFGSPVVVRFRS